MIEYTVHEEQMTGKFRRKMSVRVGKFKSSKQMNTFVYAWATLFGDGDERYCR